MLTAKQYAWAYLLSRGNAGVKYSYYGGFNITDDRYDSRSWVNEGKLKRIREDYLNMIKMFGIDWDKTHAPHSDSINLFNGTFADDQIVKEVIEGALVLKNGFRQEWIAEQVDIMEVFELLSDSENMVKYFKENLE